MDYAHANFQSFPLSHHRFTRLRNQYCSVNSMDLTWAFFLPSALSFYSTVSASWLGPLPDAPVVDNDKLQLTLQNLAVGWLGTEIKKSQEGVKPKNNRREGPSR